MIGAIQPTETPENNRFKQPRRTLSPFNKTTITFD